jgi:hypothetical protein
VLCSVQKFERGTRCQVSRSCACSVAFASNVGIPESVNLRWLNVGIKRRVIWCAVSQTATRTHTGAYFLYFLPWGTEQHITFLARKFKFRFWLALRCPVTWIEGCSDWLKTEILVFLPKSCMELCYWRAVQAVRCTNTQCWCTVSLGCRYDFQSLPLRMMIQCHHMS